MELTEPITTSAKIQRMGSDGGWMDTGQSIQVTMFPDGHIAIREEDIKPFLFGCRALVEEKGAAFRIGGNGFKWLEQG